MTAQLFRIYDPGDESGEGLSPKMRLSQFFWLWFVPVRSKNRRHSQATIAAYAESIRLWVELTGDPPLDEIDDRVVAEFLEKLAARPRRWLDGPFEAATVDKHLRHLQSVLDRTGPRGFRVRDAKNLLAEVPYLERPPVPEPDPCGDYSLAEISMILVATKMMTIPKQSFTGVTPRLWWNALIAVIYYAGYRIGRVMELEFQWIRGSHFYLPARTDTKKGKSSKKLIHPDALAAIERIRTDRAKIFPFPSWPKPSARSRLNRVWQKLVSGAGVAEDRRFGFHGLRRTHATEMSAISGIAASLSLDHGDQRTTNRHYVNPRIVDAAIAQLPRLQCPAVDDPTQRRLFEE